MSVLRLLRRAFAAWMAWRILGPELPPRFTGIQRRPLDVTGRSVLVGPHEYFVRELGDPEAPPLVLVHGWAFDGLMTFFRVLPHLSRHFRVIVPDHRNHGKSDRIRGRFDLEDLADDLAGVLDAVGVDRPVVLFGYSMGGMVAQVFTRRNPGRVDRLVLAATAAHPIDRHRVWVRLSFWLGRALARISRQESALATYRLLRRRGVIEPEHGRWLWEHLMDRDPTLYYETGHAVWRFDSRSWVGRLDVPVLQIITTDDRIVAPRTQYDLASRLREPRIVELFGADHEAILSRPQDFIDAVEAFVGIET
ncbi:MAG TPA: alpha/beta fold hydrolase [Actinobacteria bacterium]|nr:alpha/beta fold hydrolase [Actinomycetota bacterium]